MSTPHTVPYLVLLASPAAFAQDTSAEGGFDAHGFHLVAHDGDPRDPLTVHRPGPFSQGDFFLQALTEYAEEPLVRVIQGAEADSGAESVALDNLFAVNINAGVAPHDLVRIDVTAPVYLFSVGVNGAQPQALGDLRGTLMVQALRPAHVVGGGGPGLALVAHVDAPTGAPELFLGNRGVAGGGAVAATYELGLFTASADVGAQFNPAVDIGNITGTDAFDMGLAAGVLANETTGFTLEGRLAPPMQKNLIAGTGMPGEAILSFRHRAITGVSLTLGGAAGIAQGASAAAYRAFLGMGWGHVKPPRPPDNDPLAQATIKDLCPGATETDNGYKDEDGCPDELGQLAVRAEYGGQPVEGADIEITGPEGKKTHKSTLAPIQFAAIPGSAWKATAAYPEQCLYGDASVKISESTSDLVVQLAPRLDSFVDVTVVGPTGEPLPGAVVHLRGDTPCTPTSPTALAEAGKGRVAAGPGKHHVVVDIPGYKVFETDLEIPKGGTELLVKAELARAILEKTRIVILDKVFFEFNKAVIKPESFPLLDEVAGVIITHPDVGRIQVEGHTDDKGKDQYNLDLSQKRAEAVREYLIGKGVEPDRLVAKGFGETRPIADNKTEDGRSQNRRVEFNLIDQVEPAPTDGAAPAPKPGGTP